MITISYANPIQHEFQPDETGIAYVEMNSTGKMEINEEQDGLLVTSSLAGCTGVAGFAKRNDGTIATFVSHYDPLSQNYNFTKKSSPVNQDICCFHHQETHNKDAPPELYIVIGYEEGSHLNPLYGKKHGKFDEWHYVDQINTTAGQLRLHGGAANILFMPYTATLGHSLGAGRIDGQEGIFWDGQKIYFDSILPTDSGSFVSVNP